MENLPTSFRNILHALDGLSADQSVIDEAKDLFLRVAANAATTSASDPQVLAAERCALEWGKQVGPILHSVVPDHALRMNSAVYGDLRDSEVVSREVIDFIRERHFRTYVAGH